MSGYQSNSTDKIPYVKYGSGKALLLAFHGYGMDGHQFNILEDSLKQEYQIIGFHLPYHSDGPRDHHAWLDHLKMEITQILEEYGVDKFSIAGYSIGAKISLHLLESCNDKINKIYLFAPYGLENHWGLSFVSKGVGNLFFRTIVKSKLPQVIMRMVKSLKIIDQEHHDIIQKELDSHDKRDSLCKSLRMAGQISITPWKIPDMLNQHQIKSVIIYGQNDVLFPYKKRSKHILNKLELSFVDQINEGHWLITRKLDKALVANSI